MNKKVKNYIIAAVVVALALVTCAIAVGIGGQQMMSGDMGDSQGYMEESNPVAGQKVEFSTKDMDGNIVDSEIFKDSQLTIINLWAPSCSPCVEEMPEIQKLYEEYKDKVNVIGIIEEYDKKDAEVILNEQKITYTNVVADKGLQNITNEFMYIPVTLFVNNEGEILDTFVPGSTDYETLKSMVDELITNN